MQLGLHLLLHLILLNLHDLQVQLELINATLRPLLAEFGLLVVVILQVHLVDIACQVEV